MMHVHLHTHWQSCGDPAPPSRDVELPPRPPFADEAETDVARATPAGPTPAATSAAAPLWEELFMGLSPALATDPDVVNCALAPRFESVRTAREFTKLTLNRWELGELFDDIALVASELVTNALRHALAATSAASVPEQRTSHWGRRGTHNPSPITRQLSAGSAEGEAETPSPLIRLSLVRRAPQVVCAVSDPSAAGPVAREADWIAESGRGLHLVDSFSQSWGWHPVAAGKVVWALFELSEGEERRYGGG
ncbi:ATP-binding protein [Streptacidiphilus sp. MAP12-16]|uniref:ATP-binding protein n=1 Tax=Streptacidiphilus sp. MAP12-16 TaxID=3156300 RepID=UPI003514C13D